MTRIYAQQGDTVDLICQRYYGSTAGVTEAVYRANPGLADLGPVLPMNHPVDLPDAVPAAPSRATVQLWD
jgi:phage tail protein X